MAERAESLVEYYRQNRFNPVLIKVEDAPVWQEHLAKRRNLYENHLKLPLSLLAGRSVIEFGPNSGENALVLAVYGADLTLVEANEQVLPRLRELFAKFEAGERISALHNLSLEAFQTEERFQVAIAEGFLYTLPERDKMLKKIAGLLCPGGFGIVSYNDRCGGLLECLRRLMLFRLYELEGTGEAHSEASLAVARRLLGEDFARLKASRTFETWWKDTLVNPYYAPQWLWSFPEVVKLLEECECRPYATSPVWAAVDHFLWYKNPLSAAQRQARWLENWRARVPYFMSGLAPLSGAE
ncbi:MAG: methyltransferase domain-containing protein, partial [Planctomycetota bacterium]